MPFPRLHTWLFALLILCLMPAGASGTTYYLEADGSGDFGTIGEAVLNAVNGDSIVLRPGVYGGLFNVNVNLAGKAITITSSDGPDVTICDPGAANRAFCFSGLETPATVLSNLTIRNGDALLGGGIINFASPTITGNVIISNTSPKGGGLHSDGGSPIVVNNTFISNTSDVGSAIYVKGGTPVIENNTFVYNAETAVGGSSAIYTEDSAAIIQYNIFAFGTQGEPVVCVGAAQPQVGCNNFFGNAGGDVFCGIDNGNNLTSDPLFCGSPGTDNYFLQSISPCAPANNPCAIQIGAWSVGCGSSPVAPSTWGHTKQIFQSQ